MAFYRRTYSIEVFYAPAMVFNITDLQYLTDLSTLQAKWLFSFMHSEAEKTAIKIEKLEQSTNHTMWLAKCIELCPDYEGEKNVAWAFECVARPFTTFIAKKRVVQLMATKDSLVAKAEQTKNELCFRAVKLGYPREGLVYRIYNIVRKKRRMIIREEVPCKMSLQDDTINFKPELTINCATQLINLLQQCLHETSLVRKIIKLAA